MRFPKLTAAEKKFQETVSGLDLPDGIRIYAPPYFEGPDYRLEALFQNGRDLKEKIEHL